MEKIMRKKKFPYALISSPLLIATAFFIIPAQAEEENYFPLELGNWWLYQVESRLILDRGDEIDTNFTYLEVINEEEEEGCPEPLAFPWEDGYLCFLPHRYHILKKIYNDFALTQLRSTDTLTAYTNGFLVEIQLFGQIPDCTEDYVAGKVLFGMVGTGFQSPDAVMRVNCGRDTSFRYEKDIRFPVGTQYKPTNTIYGRNDNPVDGDAVYFENQVGLVLYVQGWGMGGQMLLASNLLKSNPLKLVRGKPHSTLTKRLNFPNAQAHYKLNGQKYNSNLSARTAGQILIQKPPHE